MNVCACGVLFDSSRGHEKCWECRLIGDKPKRPPTGLPPYVRQPWGQETTSR